LSYIIVAKIEVIAHNRKEAASKIAKALEYVTPERLPGLVGIEVKGAD
jgi:hypothetical protein